MPVSISPLSYESSYEIWRKILQMELVRLRRGSSIGSRKSSNSGSLDRQRVYGISLWRKYTETERCAMGSSHLFGLVIYIYICFEIIFEKKYIRVFFLDYLQDLLSKAVEYQRFN